MSMSKSKKLKTFVISAKVTVDTTCEVKAETLEEAIELGRQLGVHDFVDIRGDHNDSSLVVTGLFEVGR